MEILKIKENFDLNLFTYKHKIKIKNMLGSYSDCFLIIRKKLSNNLVCVFEEENGDEMEIEFDKIVKINLNVNSSSNLIYKSFLQRKISFKCLCEDVYQNLFQNLKKSFQSIKLDESKIKDILLKY